MNRAAAAFWRRYKAVPEPWRTILWVPLWPILLAVALWRLRRAATVAKPIAVLLAVFATPVWLSLPFSGPPTGIEQITAADQPPLPAPSQGAQIGAQIATVVRHVDGDTIWVAVEEPGGPLPPGDSHRIRLLEIDAPELADPQDGAQCWGPESSAFAQQHLPLGSRVQLVADRENTDQYGRFLRYLWTADGTFYNHAAVAQGHARAVLYEPNDAHIALLREAEAAAQVGGLGMWGAPCDHDAAAGSQPTEAGAHP